MYAFEEDGKKDKEKNEEEKTLCLHQERYDCAWIYEE